MASRCWRSVRLVPCPAAERGAQLQAWAQAPQHAVPNLKTLSHIGINAGCCSSRWVWASSWPRAASTQASQRPAPPPSTSSWTACRRGGGSPLGWGRPLGGAGRRAWVWHGCSTSGCGAVGGSSGCAGHASVGSSPTQGPAAVPAAGSPHPTPPCPRPPPALHACAPQAFVCSLLLTQVFKVMVGRLRPNFLARCAAAALQPLQARWRGERVPPHLRRLCSTAVSSAARPPTGASQRCPMAQPFHCKTSRRPRCGRTRWAGCWLAAGWAGRQGHARCLRLGGARRCVWQPLSGWLHQEI